MIQATAIKRMTHDMAIAQFLADRARPLSISEIISEMGLQETHRATVGRWLATARETGAAVMIGNLRHATWTASDAMKRQVVRNHLAQPLEKRTRVGYEQSFMDEYKPNKTFYLSEKERTQLHRQCKPDSAVFSTLTAHDQSMFLCGISWASSKMEGSAYDLPSTYKLIEHGLVMDGASRTDTMIVQNHHEAVRHIIDNLSYPPSNKDISVSARDIRSLHALLSDGLLNDPGDAGTLRSHGIVISESSYTPTDVKEQISGAFFNMIEKAKQINDPYEQSFFLQVHIPYLQPFTDCNKRTARVACNIPLLRAGVVPMSWMDVEKNAYREGLLGVYERNNTALLSEMFVDGYMRSTERFEIVRRNHGPNALIQKYRSQIRSTVRGVVLDGAADQPEDIEPEDVPGFVRLVQEELDRLSNKNEMALLLARVSESDIDAWIARERGESPRARQRER